MDTNIDERLNGKYTHSFATGDGKLSVPELKTVPEILNHHATVRPDKTAFVFLSTDLDRQKVSWLELYTRSLRVAKSVVELGIQRGETVVISFRVCPEWLFVHFGIIMAGAIPVGLYLVDLEGRGIVGLLQRLMNCTAIFLDPGPHNKNWNIFRKLIDFIDESGNVRSTDIPSLKRCICLSRPEESTFSFTLAELETLAKPDTELPIIKEDDIMLLFMSSGSTGPPKFIAHTHRSLCHCVSFFKLVGLTGDDDDVTYNGRPFSWMGGYAMNIYNGETRVTRSGMSRMPDNLPNFIYKAIQQERVTFIFTLLAFLDDLMQKQIPADWSVKTICTGGQPVARQFAKSIDKGVTKRFCVVYVSTEATMVLHNMVNKSEEFVEYACGRPFPGVEVKIVGKNGDIVPVYARGELYIRSGGMFKYYYGDTVRTKSALSEDGWYRSGDIGYMTEDGIIYVEGRESDIMVSGEIPVTPAIMEIILNQCDGVKAALVVPVPDETLHQAICVCFISKQGQDISEDHLRSYVDKIHAQSPKLFAVLPKYFLKFETFPVTVTGKISRKNLVSEAAGRITH